ncbi:MAG: response regulator [Reyranella sp.]|nr:MAG: response regulator [Reyranella sp.]TBR25813.1 MAG: response regulator [Reyranella sp.]
MRRSGTGGDPAFRRDRDQLVARPISRSGGAAPGPDRGGPLPGRHARPRRRHRTGPEAGAVSEATLYSMRLDTEQDIVRARQRARQIARLVGFDRQSQTSIATAVSEVARNTVSYGGGGGLSFSLLGEPPAQSLTMTFRDQGPGISGLESILGGTYVSPTGMGIGLIGTRRLMDEFEIDSGTSGTLVRFGKYLPRGSGADGLSIGRVAADLAGSGPEVLVEEVLAQNRDLLTTMADLETARAELAELNAELDSTNRGVLALYAELEQRADELKRASEVKSQFLSAVSHELRTPLNSITALTRMLADQTDGPLNEEQQRQLSYVRQSADTLTRLVNDLLDLAKVEAGRIDLHPVKVEVAELLSALRGIMKPLQTSTEVDLVFRDLTGGLVLYTDEGKLQQILRNLVSNALKYTERGEVSVTVATPVPGRVEFVVRDSGIGIPDDERERIFDEFVQIRNPLQTRTKGSGLGLPLSRKLAGVMGGVITVESEAGQGSTFTLDIPAVLPGTSLESAVVAEGVGKVLIVDDEESTRYVLTHMLRSEGPWALIEAADGTEGLRLAQVEMPDFILLDLHLPGLTGFEVFRSLKGDPATAHIPVLILTSSLLGPEHHERLRGAVGILSKSNLSRAILAGHVVQAMKKGGSS